MSSRRRSTVDALGVGALAQLLDFPLGREDAARLGAGAALDDVGAAEDVAVERGDRRGRARGRVPRRLVAAGNPGFARSPRESRRRPAR